MKVSHTSSNAHSSSWLMLCMFVSNVRRPLMRRHLSGVAITQAPKPLGNAGSCSYRAHAYNCMHRNLHEFECISCMLVPTGIPGRLVCSGTTSKLVADPRGASRSRLAEGRCNRASRGDPLWAARTKLRALAASCCQSTCSMDPKHSTAATALMHCDTYCCMHLNAQNLRMCSCKQ